MTPALVGILGIFGLMALIFARVPLGVAMGLVGLLGYAAIDGWDRAFIVFGTTPLQIASYSLSVLPLFILMGVVVAASGMARDLFNAASAVFAGRRGALAMAAIGACAGFSAVSGSSLATAATFGRFAVPEMKRNGYDDRFAAGSVAAGGTLGILIPPSVILVIYALAAQESVPKLFAGAIIPGVVLACLFIVVIWVLVRFKPDWAPPKIEGKVPYRLKTALVLWKPVVLFGVAVGGIYAGVFSPTEAAGMASFLAIAIAFLSKEFRFSSFVESLRETATAAAMLFFVILGAWVFAFFIGQTHLPEGMMKLIEYLSLPPWGVIVAIVIFYVVLGTVLESVAIMLVTIPVFLPIVVALGYDPVWYGVLMVVVVEIGLITPPVGLNIFVLRAQLPDIALSSVIQGILPFLFAHAILVLLLVAFPMMVLWLPDVLF